MLEDFAGGVSFQDTGDLSHGFALSETPAT
jgi:hypothetical protein